MTHRIAVVGANGQIGTALCAALARTEGVRAVAIVRSGMAAALTRRRCGPAVEVRVADLAALPDALEGSDLVINCALATSGGAAASRKDNESLLSAVRTAAVGCAIHLSTVAVYGSCLTQAGSFEAPAPDSSYGREKLRHERSFLEGPSPAARCVVRVGHVYGAHQGMSRQVFTDLESGVIALPFRGERASNAVSISRVVGALIGLAREPRGGVFNLTDEPNGGWRALYELHAHVAGLPPARLLDEAASRSACEAARAALSGSWKGLVPRLTLPGLSALAGDASVRALVDGWLGVLPLRVERIVRRRYVTSRVRAQSAALAQFEQKAHWWLFSAAVPGPNLLGKPVAGGDAALSDWYRWLSDPARPFVETPA